MYHVIVKDGLIEL